MNFNKIKNENDFTVINHEIHEIGNEKYFSVCVQCKKLNIITWFDVGIDAKDVCGDWNKYIFFKNNPNDVLIEKFQSNDSMFMFVDSVSIHFLIDNDYIFQDINGDWFITEKNS